MKEDFYLSEIYSAIQGEGLLIGARQIFVRFSVCDLRCVWCDTPESLIKTEFCQIEENAGSRRFKKVKNPICLLDLAEYISSLSSTVHHSVSFTGGEPLLQSNLFSSLIPLIRNKTSLPFYLETAGHRPDELKSVINLFDYISMDFKLPSSASTPFLWDKHEKFLEICLEAKKTVWVKIVLTDKTLFDEMQYAIDLVKALSGKYRKEIEVFLQPVTKINSSKPPDSNSLLNIHSRLLSSYPNIRVTPQVHTMLGQK